MLFDQILIKIRRTCLNCSTQISPTKFMFLIVEVKIRREFFEKVSNFPLVWTVMSKMFIRCYGAWVNKLVFKNLKTLRWLSWCNINQNTNYCRIASHREQQFVNYSALVICIFLGYAATPLERVLKTKYYKKNHTNLYRVCLVGFDCFTAFLFYLGRCTSLMNYSCVLIDKRIIPTRRSRVVYYLVASGMHAPPCGAQHPSLFHICLGSIRLILRFTKMCGE